ncbi:MFS transporter [Gephyromycinifex aptenodytis]|uniref:MFS transporter n=1 Tax=Gephyromycinifex aptenodytis TaxID=2716227 RepID=UPI001445FB3D|nr:MFS transporter [Gephyromycinifex aptenodytis]
MQRPALDGSTAVPATATLFASNGLVIGVWAASLAGLRERLDLSSSLVASALVVLGVSAIVGMQVGGRLADALGARRVALAALPTLLVGIAVIGLAASYPWLLTGAVVLGLGNGVMDVSMNAMGVQVEKRRPKPVMSFFHGMWSVGNFSGAALVLLASLVLPERAVLAGCLLAATIALVSTAVLSRITPETEIVAHVDESGAKTKVPGWAWLLGLMAIAFGLGEGTAMDWSGIHVTDVAGVPAVQGSMAVTVVAAFMVIIRLLGDRLVARFGRRAVVRFGGICSVAGYLTVSIAQPLPVLLMGWALVGFGIGMIAPQVYAVAGHAGGGRVLAVVVTFGYATFLAGPAVIGFFVDHIGVQRTMFIPALLLSTLPLLARVIPAETEPQTPR